MDRVSWLVVVDRGSMDTVGGVVGMGCTVYIQVGWLGELGSRGMLLLLLSLA